MRGDIMKKLFILIFIFIISLSIISCKKTYELTENKEILTYGQKGKYGYIYNEEVYYEVPKNIVVGLVDTSLKGRPLMNISPSRIVPLNSGTSISLM